MAILRNPSPAARRREWRAQQRLQRALVLPFRASLAEELERTATEAAAGFEAGLEQGATAALNGHGARVEALLDRFYRSTLATFGDRLIDEGARAGLVPETRDTPSEFLRLSMAWIRENAARKVGMIADTTRFRVIDAIQAGQRAGEGMQAIAKRIIQATGGVVGRRRAILIARTEVHAASQAATDLGLAALDIPAAKREWVAAEDGRTRETHRIADGQVRDQGDSFDVGGFKLRHPGDPNGPPEEIINCRCVTAAVLAEEGPEAAPAPGRPNVAVRVSRAQSEARDFVLTEGRRTGNEYLDVVDLEAGERLLQHTSGARARVEFTESMARLFDDPGRRLDLHHNHPSGSSLSRADVVTASGFRAMQRVVAHGHDGSFYAAAPLKSRPPTALLTSHAHRLAQGLLQNQIFRGNLPIEIAERHHAHLVNLALADLKVMAYDFELSEARRGEWDGHRDVLLGVLAQVLQALRDG